MDNFSDNSRQVLHALDKAVGCDLTKLAAACGDEPDDLPNTAFADIVGRQYPIHTKEATLLSVAYAHHAQAEPWVQQKVAEATDFWGCAAEASRICKELDDYRQEPKYALDAEIDGQHVQAWPFYDGATVKKAVDLFLGERAKLPFAHREKVAGVLLKAAKTYSANLDPEKRATLINTLGLGIPNHTKAAEMLLSRSKAVRQQPAWKEATSKLAQVVDAIEDVVDEDMGKLALDAFTAYDEETGLANRYATGGLTMPEDQLFPVSREKVAAAISGVVTLTNGMTVDVESLDWGKIAEVDPELYEACDKGNAKTAKEVLPTWPRGDIDILAEMVGLETAV